MSSLNLMFYDNLTKQIELFLVKAKVFNFLTFCEFVLFIHFPAETTVGLMAGQ